MSSQDDGYIEKGTQCRCRSCGTVVEVTDNVGMFVEYKAVNADSETVQQEVFAVFCIEFEPLDSDNDNHG